MPSAVTRFAPSPTGAMHLGNARTLALTWWWARGCGAEIVLRVEDLDHPRKKPGAIEGLREDLRWLGLDYDRETPIQSTRAARHAAVLGDLLARGLAYPCACTRKDVDEARSAPHETAEERGYPGTCRDRFPTVAAALAAAAGRSPALRFRWDGDDETFDDLFAGPQRIGPAGGGGDFVIGRVGSDGVPQPGYQAAVVVDDADDGVTTVVRGADLLTSAARQRALGRALGLPPVAYGHLPLVVGPDGRRLAKRHGDTRLAALRARGVTPDEIWAWIAVSCGFPPRRPAADTVRDFRPELVPRLPVEVPAKWR
jgi:glutamyl-tRNA synthetase